MGRDNARPTAPARAHGRIDDIEVLRAFAIGMVLVHHAARGLIPWVKGTDGLLYGHFGFWSGVDLFFAISGFVIARSLLPILPPASEPLAFFNTALAFWVRRAWRLLPAAWLWLAIPMAASIAFNRSDAFGSFQGNFEGALAAVLNVANAHFIHVSGRYSAGAVFHYWTLSLEEQFYIALPMLVFVARSRLPMVLVAIVASQFFIRRIGPANDVVFTMIRSDALCLGVLLAIWSQGAGSLLMGPAVLSAPLARWLLPAGFLFVFAFVSGPALGFPNPTMGLVAFLGAAIVWVAAHDRDYLFPPGRLKRALRWVGGRSYGIYLIHVPAYCATREFWFRAAPDVLQPGPGHMALLLATSLPLIGLLAELNFRLVEDPLRQRGAQYAERIRRRDASSGARVGGAEGSLVGPAGLEQPS